MSSRIGYHTFNISHLNPQPDIPLVPKSASDLLPQSPNQNHYFPAINITVLTSIPSWSDLTTFMRSFLCFCSQQCFNPRKYVLTGNMYRMFLCNNVTGSLNLIPFTCNTIRVLLPVTRVHSQFTPLSDPLLNLWVTMRY